MSSGIQPSLIPELVADHIIEEDFNNNDWETPDDLAAFVGSLIRPTDTTIVEAGAGTGQIAKYLPPHGWQKTEAGEWLWRSVSCIEVNPERAAIGKSKVPGALWYCEDFLSHEVCSLTRKTLMQNTYTDRTGKGQVSVFVYNPPFKRITEFLETSLPLLNPDYDQARILMIAPLDWSLGVKRNQEFMALGARIHKVWGYVGRVAYLKNGKPYKGRQCSDGVFDIRPGVGEAGFEFISPKNPQP